MCISYILAEFAILSLDQKMLYVHGLGPVCDYASLIQQNPSKDNRLNLIAIKMIHIFLHPSIYREESFYTEVIQSMELMSDYLF